MHYIINEYESPPKSSKAKIKEIIPAFLDSISLTPRSAYASLIDLCEVSLELSVSLSELDKMCTSKPETDSESRLWRPWESNQPHSHNAPHRRKCKSCYGVFRRESDLKRHNSSVHMRRHEPCQECEKVFTRKDNLTRHMKAHNNEGKPKCQHCSKSLSRRDAVHRHELTCSRNPVNQSHKQRIELKMQKSRSSDDAQRSDNES